MPSLNTPPPTDEAGLSVLDDALQQAAGGDHDAFELVYQLACRKVHGRAHQVLGDRALADEVTQDVFAEIWCKAARFDPKRGRAISWILTITHRRAVDQVRAVHAARRREFNDFTLAQPTDEPSDLAADVAAKMQHDSVRGELIRLRPLQLQAIALAFYGGHTHREVAAILGVPLGTAKARIRDGLLHLARALTADPASPAD